MESKKTFSYDINYNPDADGMINNMDYGGLDLYSCVMEIKDNSDDKSSTENKIFMLSNDKDSKKLSQLIITDNGPGMTPEKLAHSIIIAKRDVHKTDDIGKFGMGLNNATMALGDKIVIVAKTADGASRGLYMDLAQMRRENTFKPTLICEGIDAFKALIARDSIFDAFMSQPSGVLISVTNIKMNIENIDVEVKKLQNALSLGYKTNKSHTRIYTAADSQPIVVNEVDVFYKDTPANLDYNAVTTLRIFVDDDKKTVTGVYEILRGKRIKGKKKVNESSFYDGSIKPLYFKPSLKITTTARGKIKYEHVHEQVYELPKGQYYDITLNFAQIAELAYGSENNDSKFDGVPHRRRGLWFYRNTRCVGKCIELGSPLDDYSNRMRMEITYPPDLDYHMGMRVQKQMGTITSTAISDAIVVIWEQQNKELIRIQKHLKSKEQKKANQSDEDEYDEEEMLASFFPEAEQAAPIVKASAASLAAIKKAEPVTQVEEEHEEEQEEEQEQEEELVVTTNETIYPVDEDEDEFSDDETEVPPPATSPTPVTSKVEPVESTKSKVAGHDRITSKSERDVIQNCQNLYALLQTHLAQKSETAGIVTTPEYTELWKSVDRLINYFSQ